MKDIRIHVRDQDEHVLSWQLTSTLLSVRIHKLHRLLLLLLFELTKDLLEENHFEHTNILNNIRITVRRSIEQDEYVLGYSNRLSQDERYRK